MTNSRLHKETFRTLARSFKRHTLEGEGKWYLQPSGNRRVNSGNLAWFVTGSKQIPLGLLFASSYKYVLNSSSAASLKNFYLATNRTLSRPELSRGQRHLLQIRSCQISQQEGISSEILSIVETNVDTTSHWGWGGVFVSSVAQLMDYCMEK